MIHSLHFFIIGNENQGQGRQAILRSSIEVDERSGCETVPYGSEAHEQAEPTGDEGGKEYGRGRPKRQRRTSLG